DALLSPVHLTADLRIVDPRGDQGERAQARVLGRGGAQVHGGGAHAERADPAARDGLVPVEVRDRVPDVADLARRRLAVARLPLRLAEAGEVERERGTAPV